MSTTVEAPIRRSPALRIVAVTFVALWFLSTAWMYGAARTMAETFGPTPKAVIGGMLLAGFLTWTPLSLLAVAVLVARRERPTLRWLGTLLVASGSAIVLSELHIVIDEVRFAFEAGRRGALWSEARCWPHGTASIHYSPERGFWAND